MTGLRGSLLDRREPKPLTKTRCRSAVLSVTSVRAGHAHSAEGALLQRTGTALSRVAVIDSSSSKTFSARSCRKHLNIGLRHAPEIVGVAGRRALGFGSRDPGSAVQILLLVCRYPTAFGRARNGSAGWRHAGRGWVISGIREAKLKCDTAR